MEDVVSTDGVPQVLRIKGICLDHAYIPAILTNETSSFPCPSDGFRKHAEFLTRRHRGSWHGEEDGERREIHCETKMVQCSCRRGCGRSPITQLILAMWLEVVCLFCWNPRTTGDVVKWKEVESCGLGIQAPLALLFGSWLVLGCIPLDQNPGGSESGVFSRLWGSPYGFLSPRGDAQIGTACIHSDWSIFPRPAKWHLLDDTTPEKVCAYGGIRP